MAYRILLVAHDAIVRITRGAILAKSGYDVTPAQNADAALAALQTESFDLILVGRDSQYSLVPVDQQIRQQYPAALISKVADLARRNNSYATATTPPDPEKLLASIKFMFARQPRSQLNENKTERHVQNDGVMS